MILASHPVTAAWVAAIGLAAGAVTVVPGDEKTVVKKDIEMKTITVTTTVQEPPKHAAPGKKKGANAPAGTLHAPTVPTIPTAPTTTLPLPIPTLPVPGVTLPIPPKKPHPPEGVKPLEWADVFHVDQEAWICSAHHCPG